MKRAAVPSILVAVVLFAVTVIVEAEQPKKVPRIGYLSNTDPASESARFKAIRQALRERGYIEGQTIAIEYRYAEGEARSDPCACGRACASQGGYHRGSRKVPMGPGGQGDSHRYDGLWDRSCRGRPGCQPRPTLDPRFRSSLLCLLHLLKIRQLPCPMEMCSHRHNTGTTMAMIAPAAARGRVALRCFIAETEIEPPVPLSIWQRRPA